MTLASDPNSPHVSVEYRETPKSGKFIPITNNVTGLTFSDSGSRSTNKLSFVLDNADQAFMSHPVLMKKGAVLRASFGYPGLMLSTGEMVIKSHKGNRSQLTITCHEKKRTKMGRKLSTITYENLRRSDVIGIVVQRNGFRGFFGTPTKEVLAQIEQTNETDWQFMQRLAQLEHRELYVSSQGLHWEEPQRKRRPSKLYKYVKSNIPAGNVLDYSFDSLAAGLPGRIIACGFDPTTGKEYRLTASDVDTKLDLMTDSEDNATSEAGERSAGGAHGSDFEVNLSGLTEADAKKRVDSLYKNVKYGALKLDLSVIGDPTLRARRVVLLSGLGPALDGLYWQKSVEHKIGGGYVCSSKLTRDGIAKHLGKGQRRLKGLSAQEFANSKYGMQIATELSQGLTGF